MKQIRALSVYAFALFFNAAVSFAGFSVLTHYLNEVDFGIINLYTSFTIFLTPFIAIGTPFILSVDYFKMDAASFRAQFANAMVIPIGACLFFTLAIIGFYSLVADLLPLNTFFIVTLPVVCLMIVWNEILLNLFRNKEEAGWFAFYSIGRNLLEVSLSFFLVIWIGYGWEGRLGSSFVALLAAMLIFFVVIRRWQFFKGVWNKQAIYTLVLAGLPFIPERLAIFVLGYSDRFFIDQYRGTGTVGLYGAGAQIAGIVVMATIMLNNTFYPGLYKALSQEQVDFRKVRKIILAFIGLSLLVATAVVACMPVFFRYFIGPSFLPGKEYALYLTIGSVFWAIYNVFIAFLLNLKRNRVIMTISLLGMACSLLLNFFTVRYFGAIGAAYTNMVVYFLMALMTIIMVHRYYDLRKIFAS